MKSRFSVVSHQRHFLRDLWSAALCPQDTGGWQLTRDHGPLTPGELSPSRLINLPALAIFGRAPTAGKAKTRLIPLLGARGAAELQTALVSDTVRKTNPLCKRVSRYFFLAGLNFPAFLSRGDYTLVRQQGSNLGERLERAFRRLLRRHARAVVVGTDTPLLSPRILLAALGELEVCDAVLGPCPDGGYYLIGLRRPTQRIVEKLFRDIRWGTTFAFRDTLGNFLRSDLSCSVLETLADVDRPADVRRLKRELALDRGMRGVAPATSNFLKNLRPAL